MLSVSTENDGYILMLLSGNWLYLIAAFYESDLRIYAAEKNSEVACICMFLPIKVYIVPLWIGP